MAERKAPRWLLLIHQIPPKPAYLRVKTGRRLSGLGAVAVKNSVYVLPLSDQAIEDFQWVRREILAGAGDASVCEARFVEGLSDSAIEALFNAARDADYAELTRELRGLQRAPGRGKQKAAAAGEQARAALGRIRKRHAEVTALDFFGSRGRDSVDRLLAALEASLRRPADEPRLPRETLRKPRGRTWVTRSGVHIDRIASAWLIRRCIDEKARFKFVPGHQYQPGAREIRFDMFEAEFTHEGDACTFEVLLERFGVDDRSVRQIAEIVHDIDLKDAKFSRSEASGVERLVEGITIRYKDDEARLRDGASVFEGLYEYFKRTR